MTCAWHFKDYMSVSQDFFGYTLNLEKIGLWKIPIKYKAWINKGLK